MSSPAFLPTDSIPFSCYSSFPVEKKNKPEHNNNKTSNISTSSAFDLLFYISYEKLNAGKLIGILQYKICPGVGHKSRILKRRKIENYHRCSNFVGEKKNPIKSIIS